LLGSFFFLLVFLSFFFSLPRGLLFILFALLTASISASELGLVLLGLSEEFSFFGSFVFSLLLLLALFAEFSLLIIEEEVVAFRLLLLILAGVHLVDTRAEIDGITTEGDVHQL